jgi:hypothetical protein
MERALSPYRDRPVKIYGVSELAYLPTTITSLSIGDPEKDGVTDDVVASLARFPDLTHLYLSATASLTGASLKTLKRALPGLRHLELSGASSLKAADIKLLADFSLDGLELVACKQITPAWLKPLSALSLTTLNIRLCDKLKGGMHKVLPLWPGLTHLTLSAPEMTAALTEAIAALPGLGHLKLQWGRDRSPAGVFTGLAASTSLQHVVLDRPLAQAEAEAIARIPSLQHVELKISNEADVSASAPLGQVPSTVSFTAAPVATDSVLRLLPTHLPCIECLNLDPGGYASSGQKFGVEGLTAVRQLEKLKKINFNRNFAMKNATLAALTGHPTLESIHLGGCSKITSGAIKIIESLPAMKYLDMHGCKISNASLKKLGLMKLEKLNIGNNGKIDDSALVNLTKTPNALKSLAMSSSMGAVTDIGLTALSKLSELEELALDVSELTDAGVESLMSLSRLKILNLSSRTPLTDAWLCQLGTLASLEMVSVSIYTDTSQLSADGIVALAGALNMRRVDVRVALEESERAAIANAGAYCTTSGNTVEYIQTAWPY